MENEDAMLCRCRIPARAKYDNFPARSGPNGPKHGVSEYMRKTRVSFLNHRYSYIRSSFEVMSQLL